MDAAASHSPDGRPAVGRSDLGLCTAPIRRSICRPLGHAKRHAPRRRAMLSSHVTNTELDRESAELRAAKPRALITLPCILAMVRPPERR